MLIDASKRFSFFVILFGISGILFPNSIQVKGLRGLIYSSVCMTLLWFLFVFILGCSILKYNNRELTLSTNGKRLLLGCILSILWMPIAMLITSNIIDGFCVSNIFMYILLTIIENTLGVKI